MPEPSQLAPLDVEEQRFTSTLLTLSLRVPEPSYPTEDSHFGCSNLQPFPCLHYPKLMTISEGGNIFREILCSLFTTTDEYNNRVTADAAPICLFISRSTFPRLENQNVSFLNSCTPALIPAASHSTANHPSSSTFFQAVSDVRRANVKVLFQTRILEAPLSF